MIHMELDLYNINLFTVECDRHYGTATRKTYWKIKLCYKYPFSSTVFMLNVFHDSAGDTDFYQMSLSQSESTILHESIILTNMS